MLSWTILCYPEQSCTILRNPVLSRAFLCNPPSAILCYSEQCCTILPEQSCDIGIYQPFFIKKTKCIETRHKVFEPFWGSNIKILRTSEPQGKNTCLENKLLFYQLCYQHVGKKPLPVEAICVLPSSGQTLPLAEPEAWLYNHPHQEQIFLLAISQLFLNVLSWNFAWLLFRWKGCSTAVFHAAPQNL